MGTYIALNIIYIIIASYRTPYIRKLYTIIIPTALPYRYVKIKTKKTHIQYHMIP